MSRKRRPLDEIVPDDFTDAYPGDTIAECLEYAHSQAPTTTPASEVKRCPTCETRRVYPRGTAETMGPPREYDEAYKCANGHRFDDPVYLDPEEDAAEEVVDDPDDLAEKVGPFEWVNPDDLADPPVRRRLAALDDRRLAALVIYLYRPWSPAGPSYRDLESVVPYSSDWVGDRVRAWKDGEYHDLVRDPRPRVSLAIDAEEVSAE